jgi:hypothetical protein
MTKVNASNRAAYAARSLRRRKAKVYAANVAWNFNPRPIKVVKKSAADRHLLAVIASVKTDVADLAEECFNAVRGYEAEVKHVVITSDGWRDAYHAERSAYNNLAGEHRNITDSFDSLQVEYDTLRAQYAEIHANFDKLVRVTASLRTQLDAG